MNQNVTDNHELKGSNKLAAIGVAVESMIIMIAYLAEYLKGARTIGYSASIMALCVVIAASAIVTYVKKPDSTFIKHIVGAGFPILYAVTMFTSDNILTFTYAIPVLIVAASYADSKYSLMESVGMVLVNVVQVILLLKKGVYNSTNTAYLEIHVMVVIIICVFQALSVKRVESNNRYREGLVKGENEKTKQLLANNVSIGTETNKTIDEMYGIISELGDSIRSTAAAMAEVDQGANETADNVATQRELTADISEKVSDVSQNCSDIIEGIRSTLDAVNNGKENMDAMIVQAEKTIGNGNEVSEKLVELNRFMDKLGSVVKIISQITSQTSLLSLNASIEAARAGEAGRGFSVVASEIQTMANNTQSAANEISVMLSDVSGAIDAVVSAATEMIENIKVQEQTIRTAADSFATIEKNAVDINSISEGLSGAIMKLEDSNKEIDNSISSISAVTEQVSAHATDTVASCESNIETVDRVIDMSKQLRELAAKLSE